MDYKWIDHIVIAVKDLNQGISNYQNGMGMELERTDVSEKLGIKQAFFNLGNGTHIELVEPLGPETPVGRKIERSGEGVHLVALAVDNIEQTIKELESNGVQLIGADNPTGQVFLHPKSTNGVLIQIVEK